MTGQGKVSAEFAALFASGPAALVPIAAAPSISSKANGSKQSPHVHHCLLCNHGAPQGPAFNPSLQSLHVWVEIPAWSKTHWFHEKCMLEAMEILRKLSPEQRDVWEQRISR